MLFFCAIMLILYRENNLFWSDAKPILNPALNDRKLMLSRNFQHSAIYSKRYP